MEIASYMYLLEMRNNSCEVYGQSVTLTDKVLPVISNVAFTDPTDCGVTDGTITYCGDILQLVMR